MIVHEDHIHLTALFKRHTENKELLLDKSYGSMKWKPLFFFNTLEEGITSIVNELKKANFYLELRLSKDGKRFANIKRCNESNDGRVIWHSFRAGNDPIILGNAPDLKRKQIILTICCFYSIGRFLK